MTLTQMEYVVAVDDARHFATAAEKCFVTQPTLSMQLQKLEEELGVKIFDRSKQPVVPTKIGKEIIEQARIILKESRVIKEVIVEQKNILKGELKISIIPTLAPYLLPLFLISFVEKYPLIKLIIKESFTEQILHDLKKNNTDAGILVTPLNEQSFKEHTLFYEELFAYVSSGNNLYEKKYILPNEIDPNKLWLLEEGHCFRSQILNLCELRKSITNNNFEYEAGSIETLKKMVEKSNGITIIPELATFELFDKQKNMIRQLKDKPVREISIVTHRDYLKQKLIEVLKMEIKEAIPQHMHTLNASSPIVAI